MDRPGYLWTIPYESAGDILEGLSPKYPLPLIPVSNFPALPGLPCRDFLLPDLYRTADRKPGLPACGLLLLYGCRLYLF